MKKMTTDDLINAVQRPGGLTPEEGGLILGEGGIDALACLQAAFYFRTKYFKNEVTAHILNNAQNGLCPEDCRYCAQSKSATASIDQYVMKPAEEIMAEAERAYSQGAFRYCMVFSGTGPSAERVQALCSIIRDIKSRYPIEVCVSPGIIDASQAALLKAAGLDRLNHNLNTSERYYSRICTTHSYEDRIATLTAARSAGLAVCSGVIVGMGESAEDVVSMAFRLKDVGAAAIPVNFFMPVPGAAIKEAVGLSPAYCLRVLCLFRLVNPSAEIRMAAGREMHLRSLQPMGLYAANSLFLQGYLNVKGTPDIQTLEMIRDTGFTLRSEVPFDDLLDSSLTHLEAKDMKTAGDLRPFKN